MKENKPRQLIFVTNDPFPGFEHFEKDLKSRKWDIKTIHTPTENSGANKLDYKRPDLFEMFSKYIKNFTVYEGREKIR